MIVNYLSVRILQRKTRWSDSFSAILGFTKNLRYGQLSLILINTTLYVPKGSKEAFAQHEAWNRFGAIVEYDDVNGIGRLESGLGAADGRIYTIDGRYAGTDINALGHGMYIMDGRKVAK